MPLSDEEQRILQAIEKQFHAEDPKLANEVAKTSIYRHTGRQLKLAIIGIVVGLLLMVILLAKSILFALVGFGVAFASAVWAYYIFRRMTRAGLDDFRRKSRNFWARRSEHEHKRGPFGNGGP